MYYVKKKNFFLISILLVLICFNNVVSTAQEVSKHDELIVKGNRLIIKKKYNEALDAYEEATKLKSESFIGWYNKGITLDLLGRYEEAVVALDQAVRIGPDNHEAWFVMGNALDHNNKFAESISAFDRGIASQTGLCYSPL